MFSVNFVIALCAVAVSGSYQDYRANSTSTSWKEMIQQLQMNNYISSRQGRCKEEIKQEEVFLSKIFIAVLSLFTFVQFNNQACTTATGDNGTCLTAADCAQKGGKASGSCAAGFGSCCICEY